ncbi:MAG: PEBP family protein [Acidobacteriota bacterium]
MTKRVVLTFGALTLLLSCGSPKEGLQPTAISHLEGDETLTIDVWADNWFALYAGHQLVAEDSVPFATERSFNAERFLFRAALHLSLVVRDYLENDTGLEYIGSGRQQMGDGGLIFQVRDEAGETLAVSDEAVRCLVVHRAPLDKGCASSEDPFRDCAAKVVPEPGNWKAPDYDDGAWPAAVVHSASSVRPKGGYDQIEWDAGARLIWSEDLETDNTLLCRFTVSRSPV